MAELQVIENKIIGEIKATYNERTKELKVSCDEDYVVYRAKLTRGEKKSIERGMLKLIDLDSVSKDGGVPKLKEGYELIDLLDEQDLQGKLEFTLLKRWSKEEVINEDSIVDDVDLIYLREEAFTHIAKLNGLNNGVKEEEGK